MNGHFYPSKYWTVICAFTLSLMHHYNSLSLPKQDTHFQLQLKPDQSPRLSISLASPGSQVSTLAPS